MVVKTQCKGRGIIGLEVGADNVRLHFPRRIPAIELELGHLQIRCKLTADFWNGHPNITDRRLVAWLESKHARRRHDDCPISLDMVPVGKNSFRLQPMAPAESPAANAPMAINGSAAQKARTQPAA